MTGPQQALALARREQALALEAKGAGDEAGWWEHHNLACDAEAEAFGRHEEPAPFSGVTALQAAIGACPRGWDHV